jgi:aquaporin related protein
LNPARSLAPCIVNRSFTSYHWIYWVGPIAGTVLAVLLFKLVKALEYETVNGEEHRGSLVVHVDGSRPPAVAPLTSVSPAPPRKPSIKETATIQISRQSVAAEPEKPHKEEKKDKKEEKSVLPECYAD